MSRRDDLNNAFAEMDKRTKIMLGVLVLIVILGAGYFFLLKPSSSSSSATPATQTPSSQTVIPSATPKPTASASLSVPLPSQADPGRDPFAPLPEETVAAAAAVTTTAPTAAATIATPIPSASPSAASSHTINLVSIASGTTASIVVDGTDKTVKAGDSITTGVACIKVTADSIFVTFNNKAYALAPGQTVSF